MRRALNSAFAALLAAMAMLATGGPILANPNQYAINVDGSSNALAGYDAVAYFTDHTAIKGTAAYTFDWKGAHWLFASAAHRDLFAAAPEQYAPRVGGFCDAGAVNGRMVDVDPEQWLIVDGKLYLYLDAEVKAGALADVKESTAAAERRWADRENGLKR